MSGAMSLVERRRQGTSRVVSLHQDTGDFDRTFWASIPPEERMAAVWEMVLEFLAWRHPDEGEPRLQRSICRVERRRR